ncbi:hypothetical protein A8C32_09255 [Flavivirga aquatica]|uniref:RDD domain-containing protein n=1 Tax=Flavivirga aquatica TaxID=1849968 RepID=A0A1E5SJP8_9FLAO|nr:RDD family protein [Flavivirga aquatica]OEJ99340.1 hypothetical protein A8C32_09255 [Flavivirga aquatica]
MGNNPASNVDPSSGCTNKKGEDCVKGVLPGTVTDGIKWNHDGSDWLGAPIQQDAIFITGNSSNSSSLLNYFISYFSYFILCEYFFLVTIGKKLFKFKVIVNKSSSLNMFIAIFIRTIIRLFPFNPISFLFTKEKMFWHEIFSDTKLLPSRSTE